MAGCVSSATAHHLHVLPLGQLCLTSLRCIQDEFLQRCRAAPPGSFGHAYAEFMGTRRFLASERPPVRFVDDAELAYVATRYRQVHDFWHVIFGCHTSLLGETALKALEYAQVRPRCPFPCPSPPRPVAEAACPRPRLVSGQTFCSRGSSRCTRAS